MKALRSITILALAIVTAAGAAHAADYALDAAHTNVGFTVRHMAGKVYGSFNTFQGTFAFDPADPAKATGTIEIDAASIDTNQVKRDNHLRSADFFEVEKHPKITYVIKSAKKKGADYVVDGELTMRGITKKVPMTVSYLGEATNPWGAKAASFTATAKINRKDFGLVWNKTLETGGVLVGEEVEINLNVEAGPKTAVVEKK